MRLARQLRYDAPWLQRTPDSSADCEVLEQLAPAGVRTLGRETQKQEQRLIAIRSEASRRRAPETWPG
jgi:hypothetical protein